MNRTRLAFGLLLGLLALLAVAGPSAAAPSARISGEGSSWAGNAVQDWQAAVKAQGVTVDYNNNGSSAGRHDFATGLADFAVSEIPYTGDTKDPQDTTVPNFGYAMLPVVAGGTSFMYNVPVNGSRFAGLKLSQGALAKIFAGEVTRWNDPVIAATNPGVNLPNQQITVVVRSDGSGATAQFTLWMLRQFPQDYAALCAKTGCDPHNATSYFPAQGLSNFVAQSGSVGVTTYTSNTPYTINYDEYSYAQGVGFPVAQVQNAAGFFTIPTAQNVAVALTQAKINTDTTSQNYLSQDLSNVYPYKDPRTYPISAYSYMIEPTETHGNFDTGKGETLAYFEQFELCEGQQTMGALGYSPLPMNLVLAAMDQVLKIPGIDAATSQQINDTKAGVSAGTSNPCHNPTFNPGDSVNDNHLIDTAQFPDGCDAACQAPWIHASTNSGPGTAGTKNAGKKSAGKSPGTTSTASSGASTAPFTSGGTTTPGATSPGVTAPDAAAAPSCDPDTGVCGGDTSAASTGGPAPVATPFNLAGQQTWGTATVALLVCGALALALVLAPPLVGAALGTSRRGGARRGPRPPVPPTDGTVP